MKKMCLITLLNAETKSSHRTACVSTPAIDVYRCSFSGNSMHTCAVPNVRLFGCCWAQCEDAGALHSTHKRAYGVQPLAQMRWFSTATIDRRGTKGPER